MVHEFQRVWIPRSFHKHMTLLHLVKPIDSELVGVPILGGMSYRERDEMVWFIESIASETFTRIPDNPVVAKAALLALRFLGLTSDRIIDALEDSVRDGRAGSGSKSRHAASVFMLPVFIKASMYEETSDLLWNRFGVPHEECLSVVSRIRREGLRVVNSLPYECREYDGPWDADMLMFGWLAANHMYTGAPTYASAMVVDGMSERVANLCEQYVGKAVLDVPMVSRFCDELAEILRSE